MSRRVVLVLSLVLLLVVGAAIGTFLYIRTLYYVGVADSATPTVGIYRGVDGSVLGYDLDSLTDRSNLPVEALTDDDRDKVSDGIQADNHDDARRIVTALRTNACAIATPSVAPSATASPTPSPTHSIATTKKRRAAHPKPSPTPTPPPYCTDSP